MITLLFILIGILGLILGGALHLINHLKQRVEEEKMERLKFRCEYCEGKVTQSETNVNIFESLIFANKSRQSIMDLMKKTFSKIESELQIKL